MLKIRLLILSLLPLLLYAQRMDNHISEFINAEKGLPTNDIFHVIQDKDHFVWMATDNGVIKYDGKNIEVFNSSDGLPFNSVFRLFDQGDGTIYGVTAYNKFFYVEDDQIFRYPHNELLNSYIPDYAVCYSFFKDKEGNCHFGSRFGSVVINKHGELVRQNNAVGDKQPYRSLNFSPVGDNYLFSYMDPVAHDDYIVAQRVDNGVVTKTYTYYTDDQGSEGSYGSHQNGKWFAIVHRGHVLILDNEKVDTTLLEDRTCVNVSIIDGSVWATTLNHGAYRFDRSANGWEETDHYLDGYSVTSVLKDHQGNFWFSTKENGVNLVHSFKLIKIYEARENENISSFYRDPMVQLVGFDNGTIKNTTKNKVITKNKYQIRKFVRYDTDTYFALGTNPMAYNAKTDEVTPIWKYMNLWDKAFSFYEFRWWKENKYLLFGQSDIFIYDDVTRTVKFSFERENMSRISSVEPMRDVVRINSSKGIYMYDPEKDSITQMYATTAPVLKSFYIGDLLVGICRDGNISIFNAESSRQMGVLSLKENINRIYDVHLTPNRMLFSSNLGIHKWEKEIGSDQWNQVDFIGLKGVVKLFCDVYNRYYYITQKAVYAERQDGHNYQESSTYISDLAVNNHAFPIQDTLELSHHQNNITFRFGSVFFGPRAERYKYVLEGYNDKPVYTTAPEINFSVLPPGEYLFRVSSTADGLLFSNEKQVFIVIHPPFWQKNWFLILISGLLITLALLFYFAQMRRIKTRVKLNETLVKLRSKALTAQLNPHLIFNVLNSIQGMISEEEIEKSTDYLARFSQFMRMSLRFSKQDLVTLEEELTITRKYLELELLRFPEGLQVEVVDEAKNQQFKIPPLIIQPLIENAIKHGVAPLIDENGKIEVKITENAQCLTIIVTDNGVGFDAHALALAKGDGIRISRDRMKILNPANTIQFNRSEGETQIKLIFYK